MSFGPKKIPALEVADSILEVIKDQLLKTDAFNNRSLAYYGVEVSYKIEISLHSRGINKRTMEKNVVIGEKTDEDPKKFKLRNKASAGRKLVVDEGSHVRDRQGVEV